jgi:oxalate decarboxylase
VPSSSFSGGDFETPQPSYGPAPAPLAGTELPSFRFPLGTVAPKTFQGGTAKEATVAEFPVSDKLAGVYMTLEPGALREMHWHANAAEWAYVIDGRCRVTTIDPENQAEIVDFSPGDVWYFPRGHGHSIQGIGPGLCAFVLVFDNGYFSEFGTFSISDWVGHTPADVLARNFGVPATTFANFPKSEVYIAQGPVPEPLPQDPSPGSLLEPPLTHRYRLLAQAPDSSMRDFPIYHQLQSAGKHLYPLPERRNGHARTGLMAQSPQPNLGVLRFSRPRLSSRRDQPKRGRDA